MGKKLKIDQSQVVVDDVVVLKAGDQAVVDGKMMDDPRENISTPSVDMDETLLTGESDLIRKFAGDEILSGSFCVVGSGLFVAEKVGDDSFAQKLTAGAAPIYPSRHPAPNARLVLLCASWSF